MYYTKIAKQEKNKEKVKQTHTDTETHSLTQKSPKNFKPKSIIYTKMTYKTKRKKNPWLKNMEQIWGTKKEHPKILLSLFYIPHLLLSMGTTLGNVLFLPWRKLLFFICKCLSIVSSFPEGMGEFVHFSFSVLWPYWYRTIQALFLLPLSLQVHMYNLLLWKPCFLRSSIPSGSHGLSTSSSVEFPESWRERLDGDIPFKM